MSRHILDCLQDAKGPPLSNSQIDETERKLGVWLPAEYRAFLLRYNGGQFHHHLKFEIPSPAPYVTGGHMHEMCGIFDDSRWGDLVYCARTSEGFLEYDMLPIGFPLGDTICLCIRGENYGSVYLGVNDAFPEDGEQKFFFVAPDMLAFVNILTLDSEMERHDEVSPIFQKVEDGDLDAVRGYLKEGQPVDVLNASCHTLLMCSARNCWPKIAALLIEHGAEVHAVDAAECTALHYAAMAGSVDITRLLLAADANVNATNHAGQTALQCSAEALAYRVEELLKAASAKQ